MKQFHLISQSHREDFMFSDQMLDCAIIFLQNLWCYKAWYYSLDLGTQVKPVIETSLHMIPFQTYSRKKWFPKGRQPFGILWLLPISSSHCASMNSDTEPGPSTEWFASSISPLLLLPLICTCLFVKHVPPHPFAEKILQSHSGIPQPPHVKCNQPFSLGTMKGISVWTR